MRREREKIRKLNELVESFSHRLKMCLISASASLEPESVSVIDGALEAIAKGFEKELPNSGDEQEKNGFSYDRHRGNFR